MFLYHNVCFHYYAGNVMYRMYVVHSQLQGDVKTIHTQ